MAAIAVAILVEAAALGRLTIAIAHVLLAAILIPARGPLFTLLFVVPFLIGHCCIPLLGARRRGERVVAGERRRPHGTCGKTQAPCLAARIAEADTPPEARQVVVLQSVRWR